MSRLLASSYSTVLVAQLHNFTSTKELHRPLEHPLLTNDSLLPPKCIQAANRVKLSGHGRLSLCWTAWTSRLRRCIWVLLISRQTGCLLRLSLPQTMILIDDILEVKEETPEVLRAPAVDAIQPPPPYDQSEPLLPIASRYGTFSRFPRVLSTRRRFLKAFFVAWAVWILVYCLVIRWKDLLNPGVSTEPPHTMFALVYL